MPRKSSDMGLTTDPSDPRLGHDGGGQGQNAAYLVATEKERERGHVRPLRVSYQHEKCGTPTSMELEIAETYAIDPHFYGYTYCAGCNTHLPVGEFFWIERGKVTDLRVGE